MPRFARGLGALLASAAFAVGLAVLLDRGPTIPVGAAAPQPSSRPAEAAASATFAQTGRDEHKQRGVALGLFAEDVSFSYQPLLAEIAEIGATHVALVVPLYQTHGASVAVGLHTRFSPSLAAVAEAIRGARRAGLEVTVFPIVRLAQPRSPDEWRGTLAPANRDAWFASYEGLVGDLAALCTLTGVTRLVIGSELSSLDGDLPRWSRLIERVRAIFGGALVYSANWDHYKDAKLLDLVDEAGVVAYFDLRDKDGPADVSALAARWRSLRAEIEAWRGGRAQPFLFTEVGYRSRAGSTASPWDETPGGRVDLDEQRRAFEAFRRAWAHPRSAHLSGLYVWNWYGYGGPKSIGYTPRGKPALEEVRRLLEEL
jgi:hypothetical protein